MPQDAAQAGGLTGWVQGWLPTTFAERGVAVPFTTPQLAGARLRRTERGLTELIVPDIGGPGSVGILPWERMSSLCSPTVFDRKLATRLADVPALTPATVREAVCAEAATGLAGLEVQEAALAAQQADAAERDRAATSLADLVAASGRTAAVPPDLAALFGAIGLGAEADTARLPRSIAAVAALSERLGEQRQAVSEAEVVALAARRTAGAAVAALHGARGLAAGIPVLLRRWMTAPGKLADELARTDWMLDGWDRLCRLWQAEEEPPGGRAALIAELAAQVPPVPREMGARLTSARPHPSFGARAGDWRSGVTMQDLVARNERLLAALLRPAEGGAGP